MTSVNLIKKNLDQENNISENMWDLFVEVKESMGDTTSEKNINETNIKKNVCTNCNKQTLVNDNQNIICNSCGVINGAIIDQGQEWRYYGSDDNKLTSDPTRCGLPINPLLPESSLSTVILGRGYEVYRKLNSWNGMTYKERSLITVLNNIAKKAKLGHIPSCIIDRTIVMYKLLSEEHIKRGDSRESLIAACLLYALKDKEIARCSSEIAELFNIKPKKLSKGCNQFTEMMYAKNPDFIKRIKPTNANDCIKRFSVILSFPEKYKKISLNAAILADKLGICQDNNPKSVAVGCIYLVSQVYQLGYTKKEIAKGCKTSEVTITHTYTQLLRFKKYLLPNKKKK